MSTTQRTGIIEKERRWMEFCESGAKLFSTCGKRQYFAIILDERGRILGQGYNGGPRNTPHCVDGACPRLIEGSAPGSDYGNCIAIHAEANAILHTDYHLRQGAVLVVNGPPCWDCAKLIANSGIVRVVYRRDESYLDWPRVASFLAKCGVFSVSVEDSKNEQLANSAFYAMRVKSNGCE